jgi:hypothetical protein
MTNKHGRDDNKVPTPFKRQKTSKDIVTGSDSEQSSGSSDIVVTTASNQDLIVSVRETTTSSSSKKVALLSISNSRPDTTLGKVQGDHVTAYKSFLEMLIAATEGSSLKKAAHIIAKTAKSLIPNKAEKFEKILKNFQDELKKITSRKLRHRVLKSLQDINGYSDAELDIIKEDLKSRKRAVYIKTIEQIGQEFIKQINLDEETAFKKEGPSDTREGARVKKAIHALKAINDLKSIYQEQDSDIRETRMDRFYSKYIEVGAPYKDGANAIFGESRVRELSRKWSYILDKKAFLNKLYADTNKEIIGKMIGNFFGDLFDFKYSIHGSKMQSSELLYKVVAKHIVTMFRAFDELQSFDDAVKEKIIEEFLQQEILKEQEWDQLDIPRTAKKIVNLDLKSLQEGVNKYLNFAEYRIFSNSEINANPALSVASTQSKSRSK